MGDTMINYLRFSAGPTLITAESNPNIPIGDTGRGRVVLEDFETYNDRWII